jgi:hypothetical protein
MMRRRIHGISDTVDPVSSGTGADKFHNITLHAMHHNRQKDLPSSDHNIEASLGSSYIKPDSMMNDIGYKGFIKRNDLSPENLTKIIAKHVIKSYRAGNIITDDLSVSQTDVEFIKSEDIDPIKYENLGYSNFAEYKDDLLGYFTPERQH